MPNDADVSKVRTGGDGNIYYMRDGERASIIGNIRNIKPLPRELDYVCDWEDAEISFRQGWNACLDKILGETE